MARIFEALFTCHAPAAGKRLWTFLAALFFLILAVSQSIAGLPASSAAHPATPPHEHCIRIATWNLHDCSATDQKTGEVMLFHSLIARALRDQKIDIIALQEVQVEGRKGADIMLLQRALETAGWPMPHAAWAKSPQSDDLAILSRFPILASAAELNPSSAPWPRPVLYARIAIDARTLDLYTAHFKAFQDAKSLEARKSQARALAALLKSRYGTNIVQAAVILAGDFNTIIPEDMEARTGTLALLELKDDSDPSNDFQSANLKWKYLEPTYLSRQYASVTDHIVLSPLLAALAGSDSIELIDPPDSGFGFPISDHRLLVLCLPRSAFR